MLSHGEASVGFLYTSQVIAALAENPDLEVVYPEEGLGFGIMGMFIQARRLIRTAHISLWTIFSSLRLRRSASTTSAITVPTRLPTSW